MMPSSDERDRFVYPYFKLMIDSLSCTPFGYFFFFHFSISRHVEKQKTNRATGAPSTQSANDQRGGDQTARQPCTLIPAPLISRSLFVSLGTVKFLL